MKAKLIIWRDCTHTDEGSMLAEEILSEPLIEMHTIGFEIGSTEDYIALGMEYIPEQERFRHVTWVPRVNIVKQIKVSI
jgi:hypothetical protein